MARRIQAAKPNPKRDTPREFRACAAGVAATIRAAEGDAKLPTFDGVAYTGAPMRPDGWYHKVVIDLDGVRIPSQHRPALRQHDHEQIVGHTTSVQASSAGIAVAGVLSGQAEHVDKVAIPARNGFQWQLSVGADPVRTEFLEAGKEATVNGRAVTGPLTISRETVIGEISFVPLGADGDTSANVHASKGKPKMFKSMLKKMLAELRAAGQIKAAKFSDEDVEKMDETEAKAALKECMKAADDEEEEDDDEEDEKTEAKAARKARLAAEAESVMAALRKRAAGEHQRQSDIAAAVRRHGVTEIEIEAAGAKKTVNLVAHAIAQGWSTEKAELEAIRASRPSNVGGVVPGGLGFSINTPEMNEAVLEAAVLQAARHEFRLEDDSFYFDHNGDNRVRRVPEYVQRETQRDMKARYVDQVQQAAHTMFRGRIGFQRLLVTAARMNGYTGSDRVTDSNGSEVMRFAAGSRFGGIQAEGASTASIANVLSNVLNKFMLQGYLFVEQSWRQVAAIRPVNDFKPTKSINLLVDSQFQKVPASGELVDASLTDQAFSNQADQYGRILTINRKNIINDDLGILTTAPMQIGTGGGKALNSILWSLFLNPGLADDGNDFFADSTGTHGTPPAGQQAAGANLISGGSSALSSTALQLAKKLFDKQVDPLGNPLGFDGDVPTLLFPPELWQTAMELVDPSAIGLVLGAASTTRQPNVNLWKGRLKPVMSRYLSNAAYTGNSATAWYILFNPAALAVIEACFLGGVDTPTVQMANQDFQFDRLGMSIRGVLDFGVNMQNFRGGVKSAGA